MTAEARREENASADKFLDRALTVTQFTSQSATTKRERQVTLRELMDMIRHARARTKELLPWVKLARFGEIRTDAHCLRHDHNVLAITGVEADYDGEVLPFQAAVLELTRAGLLAIVYTSPSHTDEKPRWRVLCPISTEFIPERRAALLGRLNGLMGGIFSGESWTLSQSYFYGAVGAGANHSVVAVEGEPIDTLDELDEIWRGKPNTGSTAGPDTRDQPRNGPVDEAALLDALIHGDDYHQATIRLVGLWARRGVAMLDAEARLLATFDDVFPDVRDVRWTARRADVPRCVDWVYGREARSRDEAGHSPNPGSSSRNREHTGKTAEPHRPLSVVHPPDLEGRPCHPASGLSRIGCRSAA